MVRLLIKADQVPGLIERYVSWLLLIRGKKVGDLLWSGSCRNPKFASSISSSRQDARLWAYQRELIQVGAEMMINIHGRRHWKEDIFFRFFQCTCTEYHMNCKAGCKASVQTMAKILLELVKNFKPLRSSKPCNIIRRYVCWHDEFESPPT